MIETKHYMIEYFESPCPSYDSYMGEDAYEAVADFRKDHPHANLQNVCLILNFEEITV
jgi:ATP-dependent protease HslVU (ClpYQ) peptidase subunit